MQFQVDKDIVNSYLRSILIRGDFAPCQAEWRLHE
uniref:Uncharacterized protein n=1 Tax=Klebsiella phage vB_KpnM_Iguana_ER37 TaxID=3076781 RepID=A0AB38Z3W4_9CAUD